MSGSQDCSDATQAIKHGLRFRSPLATRLFIQLFHNLPCQFIGIGRESLAWRLGSMKGKPYNPNGRQCVAGFYLHIERIHWSETGLCL